MNYLIGLEILTCDRKYKKRSTTKHYTEILRSSNMTPLKSKNWTLVLWKGEAVPAPLVAPVVLS